MIFFTFMVGATLLLATKLMVWLWGLPPAVVSWSTLYLIGVLSIHHYAAPRDPTSQGVMWALFASLVFLEYAKNQEPDSEAEG